MRRLRRALQIYKRTDLTWSAAWRQAARYGGYCVVARRDGFLYIQPVPQR